VFAVRSKFGLGKRSAYQTSRVKSLMPDDVGGSRWRQADETPAADLIRECGEKLTDRLLWSKFQQRFQGLIFLYLMRSLRLHRIQDDVGDVVPDLAQEVYVRLV